MCCVFFLCVRKNFYLREVYFFGYFRVYKDTHILYNTIIFFIHKTFILSILALALYAPLVFVWPA